MNGVLLAVLHPPHSFFVKPELPSSSWFPVLLLRESFRSYLSSQNSFPNWPRASLGKTIRNCIPTLSPHLFQYLPLSSTLSPLSIPLSPFSHSFPSLLSHLLPVLAFYKIYYHTPLSTSHSIISNKRDLKHYECGVACHLLPPHLAPRL